MSRRRPVLSCPDVLDVESQERRGRLGQVAVLTAVRRAASHQLSERRLHLRGGLFGEKLASLCLKDRDEVKGLTVPVVLRPFLGRERPFVGLVR